MDVSHKRADGVCRADGGHGASAQIIGPSADYDSTVPDPRHAKRGRFRDLKIAVGLLLHSHPNPVLFLAGVVAPVLGTFLLTLGQQRKDRGDWAYLLTGIAVLFIGGLLLWAKQRASEGVAELDLKVADRFRIALKGCNATCGGADSGHAGAVTIEAEGDTQDRLHTSGVGVDVAAERRLPAEGQRISSDCKRRHGVR